MVFLHFRFLFLKAISWYFSDVLIDIQADLSTGTIINGIKTYLLLLYSGHSYIKCNQSTSSVKYILCLKYVKYRAKNKNVPQ